MSARVLLRQINEGESPMKVEVWLYGPLARYAGETIYAHLELDMPAGSTIQDLLEKLGIPSEERGITFVNGQLTAMPGIYPDLGLELNEGDRVGIFHQKSMWPFQYRFGAPIHKKLQEAMKTREGGALHHSYRPLKRGAISSTTKPPSKK